MGGSFKSPSQPISSSTVQPEPISSNLVQRRGVVAVIQQQDQFLVIRRSEQVRAPGAYCFPGGTIEAGETEEQTLRREMVEELNLAAEPVRRLWESVTPWGTHLAWWLANVRDLHPLRPLPAEVAEVHWLTQSQMLDLAGLLPTNRDFFAALTRGDFWL